MSKPKVTLRCPADNYAGPDERIIEFSSSAGGGLIAFLVNEDELMVHVYHEDPSVRVYWMTPADLVTLSEIATFTGSALATVRSWIYRAPNDFPVPWRQGSRGEPNLYLRRDVIHWLESTGRRPAWPER